MRSTPNKLLATVLACLLAFAPLGNALAVSDVCEGRGMAMTEMDHTQHLDATQTVTSDITDSEGSSSCQCCAEHTCSAHACGASVALASAMPAQPERTQDVLIGAFGDRDSSDRQTPPFKPPRVGLPLAE